VSPPWPFLITNGAQTLPSSRVVTASVTWSHMRSPSAETANMRFMPSACGLFELRPASRALLASFEASSTLYLASAGHCSNEE
jgi:hypothetical protein